MKKTFKSMLALMLVAVMCFGLVGTAAFAEEISWTDGDGNEAEDLAGDFSAATPDVQGDENSKPATDDQSAETQESENLAPSNSAPEVSAPLTVSVDGGSYSYADGVITVTPAAGKYVKTVKLNGEDVIEHVTPSLESTVVKINLSKLGTVTEADNLVITTEVMPAEVECKGAYAETRYGNFEFDMDLTGFVVSEKYEYDKDGNPTSFLGYTVSDALVQDEGGLDNVVFDSSGAVGFYDYYSEKSMYIVFDSGASVAVPVGDSVSFKPVLPFTVKVVAVVYVQFTIGGEFETFADIPNHFDVTNEQGITVNADFDHASNGFYNVTLSAQGNVLENGEYFLDLINGLILTNQAVLTITAPTETKTYNGSEQSVGAPTLSVTEADLGIKDVVYLYNGSETKPTEPGTYTVTIKSYTLTDKGAAVSNPNAVYTTINTVDGKLTIAPIEISVTLKDSSAQYDGLPHTPAYDVVGSFLSDADKQALSISFKSSVTNYTDTPVDVEFNSGTVVGREVYYNVVCPNGSAKVTITKAPITFTVGSCTKEYTGTDITATIKNDSHPDGDVTVTSTPFACADDKMDPNTVISGSAVNAGKYQVLGLDGMVIRGAGDADVTANYAITVNKGTLTITPKANLPKITITIKGAEKTYDGKDLILSSTVTMDAEAQKTVGSVTITDLYNPNPNGLSLGSKPFESTLIGNNILVTLKGTDGTTVLSNSDYSIEIIPAYAAIKKATLNITPASVTKNYDGNAYNGTITKSATFGGEAVTITATAKAYKGDAVSDGVAVGTYTLKVDPATVTITNKDGVSIVGSDPITDYFNINCTASTLTVKASIGSATYSKSAGGTVTITCSLPKEALQNIVVGNTILVEGTHYTINPNSNGTAVTFKDSEFLKSLAVDNYTVVFNYGAPVSTAMKTTLKVTQNGVTSSTASPQTGDTSNTTLWTVILAVCFVLIIAVVVIIIRQKKKGRV